MKSQNQNNKTRAYFLKHRRHQRSFLKTIRNPHFRLNQAIREGTKWIVYEPNNEQLWAKTVQSVENFLNSEWRNGALMGTKPEQAYFVKMDRTTMTANDLAQEKRIFIFGVAITRPAEFFVMSIVQNEP